MVTPAWLEHATSRLEGGCSIQLSYGALNFIDTGWWAGSQYAAASQAPVLPPLFTGYPQIMARPQCDQGCLRLVAKLSE